MLKKVDFKKRVDELDFFKGIAVVVMIINHIIYDLGIAFYSSLRSTPLEGVSEAFGNFHSSDLSLYLTYFFSSGIFIVVSGILSSFSRNTFKEGVFLAFVAATITAVSAAMSSLMNMGGGLTIWFGILHLMAVCMLLSPIFKKLPKFALPFVAALLFALGILFHTFTITDGNLKFLAILNFRCVGFYSSDYFPILPFAGLYAAGVFIGKLFYAEKPRTLLPFTSKKAFLPLRFLGAYTFEIYILHQPLLYLICYLITLAVK